MPATEQTFSTFGFPLYSRLRRNHSDTRGNCVASAGAVKVIPKEALWDAAAGLQEF